jgi:biopolymer transport protein ExbB/TolQ
MFDFLIQGGTFMWVLLGWSILGLGFIIERFVALWFRYRIDSAALVRQVLSFVTSRNYARAIEVCNGAPRHPLSRVLKAGLIKANRSDKEIRGAMEEEMLRSLPAVQRNVDFVAMASNVATLLGLLGTIFGLIMAFMGVAGHSAQARQEALARGISVAMYTTAFGLIIAIPFLFCHYWLNRRATGIVENVEECSVALLNALSTRRDAGSRSDKAA